VTEGKAAGLLVFIALALGTTSLAQAAPRPLVPPECITDIGRVQAQYPTREPNRYYLFVRELGDYQSEEWQNQVATPVTWDVSVYSGFRPPEPLADWQRGRYNDGPPSGTSAVQLHCTDVGFILNTYSFQHTVEPRGGGPHYAYEHVLGGMPRIWQFEGSALHFSLDLRIPWVYTADADPSRGLGVGQVTLFYYAIDESDGRLFAHIIALFDTRPLGVGNGREFIGNDTYVDFASTPLADVDADGKPLRYLSRDPGSASYRNVHAFGHDAPLHFAATISRAQIQQMLGDLGSSSSAQRLRLLSVGVLVEAAIGYNNDYNVSWAGSFSNLTVSTTALGDIFRGNFEAHPSLAEIDTAPLVEATPPR
jgi:hypothetical protein